MGGDCSTVCGQDSPKKGWKEIKKGPEAVGKERGRRRYFMYISLPFQPMSSYLSNYQLHQL